MKNLEIHNQTNLGDICTQRFTKVESKEKGLEEAILIEKTVMTTTPDEYPKYKKVDAGDGVFEMTTAFALKVTTFKKLAEVVDQLETHQF